MVSGAIYDSSLGHLRDLLELVRIHLVHRDGVRNQAAFEAGEDADKALPAAFLVENVEPHRVALPPEVASALVSGRERVNAQAAASSGLRWPTVTSAFALDPLEEHLLLTAIAPQFSSGFEEAFRKLVPGFNEGRVTAGAMADLVARSDEERWAALALLRPDAPLMRAGLLVGDGDAPGQARPFPIRPLAASPVLIDFLLSEARPVRRPSSLAGMARWFPADIALGELPVSSEERDALERLAGERPDSELPPISVVITGGLAPRTVAAAVSRAAGRDMVVLSYLAPDRDAASAHAYRQTALYARLHDLTLVVALLDPASAGTGAVNHMISCTVEAPQVLIVAPEPIAALSGVEDAAMTRVKLTPMTPVQRRWVWRRALTDAQPADATVERLAASFALDERAIREVCQSALADAVAGSVEAEVTYPALARRARSRLSAGLEGVAERIETDVDVNDLIVSDAVRRDLDAISAYVEHLGVIEKRHNIVTRRGRGTSALFHGPSGTGKTFAAAIIARATERDLYRIDLAQVIDKYIGETEKRLERVFRLAQASDSIILFDEADSLFSKRSQVQSSHDRYANLQVNFLLQRMESYSGMSILTTNLVESIDKAFRRRLQFQIHFPKPDPAVRLELWLKFLEKIGSPDIEGHALETLAKDYDMSGAHIRNAVIKGAVLASSRNVPVDAAALHEGAISEYKAIGGLVRSRTEEEEEEEEL